MRRGWNARFGAALVAIGASAPALATTVERLTLADLVSRAERIVDARIADVQNAKDLRGRPATRLTLAVKQSLKGISEPKFEFLIPGGIDDAGNALTIPGIPVLRKGDEVMLFVSQASSAGLRVPIGLGQGTYRASIDVKSKKTLYTPDLAGAEFVDPASKKPVEVRAASVERDAFFQQIRTLVEKK